MNLGSNEINIHFKLASFLADNLGTHTVLGFTAGFRGSSFCRFCQTSSKEIHIIFDERKCSLQTSENYETDLAKNNQKITGIVENCIFHSLPDFHVTRNISVDVMHDILEGVCQYDLGQILYELMKKDKLFSLSEANNRIRGFDYDYEKNKPPEILELHIKNKRLMMTSFEMLCFVPYFAYILVLSLFTALYLQLRDIVEIEVSSNLHITTPTQFRVQIIDYLQLFNTLFLAA